MTFPHQYVLYWTSSFATLLVMYSNILRSFAMALTDLSGFLSIVFWAFCTDLGVLMLLVVLLACVLRLFAAIRYLSVAPSSFQTFRTELSLSLCCAFQATITSCLFMPSKLAVRPHLSEKRR